jgi:uncharacterized protein YjaZ
MENRDAILQQAHEILEQAKAKVMAVLPQLDIAVELEHNPGRVIPELGISGHYRKIENTIQLWIDADHEFLQNNLQEQVTRSFAHEYMHAYREQSIPWENNTFLEHIIAEGLTQSFELEIWPQGKPALYAIHLTEDELLHAWERVQSLLQKTEYDYTAWFFGSEKEHIKRWTGYNLGYWLVQKYLNKEQKKPSDVGQLGADIFIIF